MREHAPGQWSRFRGLALIFALSTSLMALGAAAPPSPASNRLKTEFAPFADCPVETAQVCLVATTLSGEFKLDLKSTPIVNPVTLQGGLASSFFFGNQPLIGAVDGNTLSTAAQPVPGGLTGLSSTIGGEVTATAELAGPPSSIIISRINLLAEEKTAVTLPIKVKLDNEVLGDECYIGTDADPIVLHLTTGTTEPPPPNRPISGTTGTLQGRAKGRIVKINGNSLVDNSFAVPGASGCGGSLSPVLDLVVDAGVGVPAPAGLNTAIMNGEVEETSAAYAAKYKPKPKKGK